MLELKVLYQNEWVRLQFEHSLRSVSKWESKYKRLFFGSSPPTDAELLDYYSMMLLSPEIDPDLVYLMDPAQMIEVNEYINSIQSASTVPKIKSNGRGETLSSELLYHWLTEMGHDWSCEDWHISRLLMLLQITNFKRQPAKKQNDAELMARWPLPNET